MPYSKIVPSRQKLMRRPIHLWKQANIDGMREDLSQCFPPSSQQTTEPTHQLTNSSSLSRQSTWTNFRSMCWPMWHINGITNPGATDRSDGYPAGKRGPSGRPSSPKRIGNFTILRISIYLHHPRPGERARQQYLNWHCTPRLLQGILQRATPASG